MTRRKFITLGCWRVMEVTPFRTIQNDSDRPGSWPKTSRRRVVG
jgi:hypothetical protein